MNNDRERKDAYIDPRVLGLIIGIVAILTPFGCSTFGPEENIQLIIIAMTWIWTTILSNNTGPVFRLTGYHEIAGSLVFTFLRFVFAFQIVRYYRNKIDRKSVIMWAIISETPLLILLTMLMFLSSGGLNGEFQIIIPLPIVLIIGLIIVYVIPSKSIFIWDPQPEENIKEA